MRVAKIACILFSSAAFALQPSTPPMKMGLWEITTTSTMKATGKMADAMQKMGQPMGAPSTQSMKMCMTLENWQKAVSGNAHPGCTQSNVSYTGKKYTVTLTCNRGTSTMTTDVTTFLDGAEQIHGIVHMVSNSDNGQMTSDGTSTGKFISSDCGDVKPIGSNLH